MKLELISLEDNEAKISIKGESNTLLNLLRESIWKQKPESATYKVDHPYLSDPELIVKAKNPMKVLDDSAQDILDQVKELGKEFSKVLKK